MRPPPLPAAAARALTLARDPNSRADDLAKVVATDGALVARVLAMSRSVVYVRRHPPQTLREAITTLGFRTLRRILIAASARSTYRADDAVAQTLWTHALATALAADELAKTDPTLHGSDAFVVGLLHDVGKLVLHLSSPREFATLGVFDEERERALFGATHGDVGALLAERWGLGDEVVEAIMFHHGRSDGVEPSRLSRCIADADRLAHAIGYGSFASAREDDPPDRSTVSPELAAHVRTLFESERGLFD